MARKTQQAEAPKKEADKEVLTKSTQPLVFISHDSRDADLATEFCNLLKIASTGALKPFSSSDKKGTLGIEYGSEWYPAIMEKIEEASDVICLLTLNSVNRPWILYEAGVAKGKLNKKVIGLALGIPFSTAITGPFAQFQNNDGDVDSITKLVIDLIRKRPDLDPDEKTVKTQVETFVSKAAEITGKMQKPDDTKDKDKVDGNSVAKLFEEVKIMFDDLPSRIEGRVDPDFRRRKRKFHPMMFQEIMHMGMEFKEPNMAFLMLISLYKDDFPWLYEIGLETYRGLKTAKTASEKNKLISTFEKALEMFSHPVMREFQSKSDESYFFYKESRHMLHEFLHRFLQEEKHKE